MTNSQQTIARQTIARLVQRDGFTTFAVGNKVSRERFTNPVDAAYKAVETVRNFPHIKVEIPKHVQDALFVVWHIEGVNLCDSNQPELIWNPWQREGYQERQQFITKFKSKKGK